jgi:hypothetical protein
MANDNASEFTQEGENEGASLPVAVEAKRKMGRPTVYSEEVASTICHAMEAGKPIWAACDEAGIAFQTYFDWQRKNQEFSERTARARAKGADAYVDEAERILAAADNKSIQVARELAHHLRWKASKLAPRFSDRAQLELTGANGGPIEVSDARAKLLAKLGIADDSAQKTE